MDPALISCDLRASTERALLSRNFSWHMAIHSLSRCHLWKQTYSFEGYKLISEIFQAGLVLIQQTTANHSFLRILSSKFFLFFFLSMPSAQNLSWLSYSDEPGQTLKKLRDPHHNCFMAWWQTPSTANLQRVFLESNIGFTQRSRPRHTESMPCPKLSTLKVSKEVK